LAQIFTGITVEAVVAVLLVHLIMELAVTVAVVAVQILPLLTELQCQVVVAVALVTPQIQM
jgi:hypothetical protein